MLVPTHVDTLQRNETSETINMLQIAWIMERGSTFEKTVERVGPERDKWDTSLTV
jgi:hypothetical protein